MSVHSTCSISDFFSIYFSFVLSFYSLSPANRITFWETFPTIRFCFLKMIQCWWWKTKFSNWNINEKKIHVEDSLRNWQEKFKKKMPSNCEIYFDGSVDRVYYGGQLLSGRVKLSLSKEKIVRGTVNIYFQSFWLSKLCVTLRECSKMKTCRRKKKVFRIEKIHKFVLLLCARADCVSIEMTEYDQIDSTEIWYDAEEEKETFRQERIRDDIESDEKKTEKNNR